VSQAVSRLLSKFWKLVAIPRTLTYSRLPGYTVLNLETESRARRPAIGEFRDLRGASRAPVALSNVQVPHCKTPERSVMGKKRDERPFDRRKLAKNREPGVGILHARARRTKGRGVKGRETGINRETSITQPPRAYRVSSINRAPWGFPGD